MSAPASRRSSTVAERFLIEARMSAVAPFFNMHFKKQDNMRIEGEARNNFTTTVMPMMMVMISQ
jgi:hypothetical protein